MIFAPVLTLALGFSSLAPVDRLFLQTSAEDSIAELRLVKMAVSHTKNLQVRRACEIMIRDHTRELAEVRNMAKAFGVDLPTEPTAAHQALFEHLSKEKGHEFDKSFVGAQLQDHISDVNTSQDEVEVGVEPRVRQFAKKGVLLLARHEVIWRKVAPSVGVEKTFGRPSAEEILAGKKM